MNITILTYGSQGDVEPFIALGHRLCRSGHQVRLAGPAVFKTRYDFGEIEFFPLPGEPAKMVQDLADQAGSNYFQMIQSVSKFVFPLVGQVFAQARAACQDADLIIHSFLFTSTGIGLAREMGIPNISAQLFPVFSSTSAFPSPTFPDLPLGSGYRRLTHTLISQTFKWGSRFLYQRVKRKNSSLPEMKVSIPGDRDSGQIPILYGFSSQVVPRPRDWKSHLHLTGYWLLEEQQEQTLSPQVLDFIRSGPPPITVAFGSTRTQKMDDIRQKVIQALAHCKQRGIFISNQLQPELVSPDLLQLAYAPYRLLFNHSTAVIHHGGAGTTAEGLMAGVPNIIIPFSSDQPFWGRQVQALGAGPEAIPARRLTIQKLISAINLILMDQTIQANAHRIGSNIKEEDGCAQAVAIIEKYLETGKLV